MLSPSTALAAPRRAQAKATGKGPATRPSRAAGKKGEVVFVDAKGAAVKTKQVRMSFVPRATAELPPKLAKKYLKMGPSVGN